MLFGYEFKKVVNTILPVSDIEKTLTDLMYFKVAISVPVLKEILKRLDKEKFEDYIAKTNKLLKKRLSKLLNEL